MSKHQFGIWYPVKTDPPENLDGLGIIAGCVEGDYYAVYAVYYDEEKEGWYSGWDEIEEFDFWMPMPPKPETTA